jgi:hypothetical protein
MIDFWLGLVSVRETRNALVLLSSGVRVLGLSACAILILRESYLWPPNCEAAHYPSK